MFRQAINLQATLKYMIQGVIMFILFFVIYTLLDRLNMRYNEMNHIYGFYLVFINIFLNILMSLSSAFLMNMSTAMVVLKGKEGKTSSFGILSVFFGILTYGCTSCVIAFFASIGIAFSVIVLPLAGLPYKLVSLFLILIGLGWIIHELRHNTCRIQ